MAIERDEKLIAVAAARAPGVEILHADALEVDWAEVLAALPQPCGIVSNMPYNITGPLLERVERQAGLIYRAVLMMQREVGDKILAAAGDRARGALSVILQARFEIDLVCRVTAGAFWPPPKVDSVVLEFRPKSDVVVEAFPIVRAGFRQPRKTLANNLSELLGKAVAQARIQRAGLSGSVRPHELSWEKWVELSAE